MTIGERAMSYSNKALGLARSTGGDLDILPAAVAVAGGIAVEAGDAVAIGVDRPVPGAGQVEPVAHVGGGEDVDAGIGWIGTRTGRAWP